MLGHSHWPNKLLWPSRSSTNQFLALALSLSHEIRCCWMAWVVEQCQKSWLSWRWISPSCPKFRRVRPAWHASVTDYRPFHFGWFVLLCCMMRKIPKWVTSLWDWLLISILMSQIFRCLILMLYPMCSKLLLISLRSDKHSRRLLYISEANEQFFFHWWKSLSPHGSVFSSIVSYASFEGGNIDDDFPSVLILYTMLSLFCIFTLKQAQTIEQRLY